MCVVFSAPSEGISLYGLHWRLFNSNYRKDTGTFYISALDFHREPANHQLIWTSTHFANIWLNPVSAAGRHVPINYLKRESLNSWQWPHAHFARQHTLHTLFVLVVHFLILLTLFPAVETSQSTSKVRWGNFRFPTTVTVTHLKYCTIVLLIFSTPAHLKYALNTLCFIASVWSPNVFTVCQWFKTKMIQN